MLPCSPAMLVRAFLYHPCQLQRRKGSHWGGCRCGGMCQHFRSPNSILSGAELVLAWNDSHSTVGSFIPLPEQSVARECHSKFIPHFMFNDLVVPYCTANHGIHLSFLVTSISNGIPPHLPPKTLSPLTVSVPLQPLTLGAYYPHRLFSPG